MNDQQSPDWPLLRVSVPQDADLEQTGRLTQAAVDAGALGALSEPGHLLIYLPREAEDNLLQAIGQVIGEEAEAMGWNPLDWRREAVADQPWATAWRANFKSLALGRRLLVRPEWERGQPAPTQETDKLTIWLQPGFGFGTGRHETTQLALEMLENHLAPGAAVLDFGSGSGLLAIAAIRLGAGAVIAIELDPQANYNARENFALNDVADRIRLYETSRPAEVPGNEDLIVCNMLPHEALPHMHELARRLADDQSVLIYSGFLADQKSEVEQAFHVAGMEMHGFARLNEWGAVFARRAKRS